MMEKYQRVYASVHLDRLLHNMEKMKQNCKENTNFLAVIKTDGYGHGSLPIASELEEIPYVFGYATATAEEAFSLRSHNIHKPILILGHTFSYCYEELIKQEIRPAVFRYDTVQELSNLAQKLHQKCKVHIKVDTGMSRIGIYPDETGLDFIKELMHLPGIEIEGIFTHFARADEKDKTVARKQLLLFHDFLERIENELGLLIPIKHCSNSAGILELPEANMNMVRSGITMYGLWPSEEMNKDWMLLKPVMELKSHIAYIKMVPPLRPISYGGTYVTAQERKIATIPVGYGDGYPRSLSNKGYVLIHGQKAKICGRICMDQFMVDITDIKDVKEDEEVTLIGADSGATITMEELGELSGRFNYEFACDLNKRVPRIYFKNEKIVGITEYM